MAALITPAPVNVTRSATGAVLPGTNDSGGTRSVVGDVPVMSAGRQQPLVAPADAVSDRRNEGAFKITMEPAGREGNTLFLEALAAQKRGDIARARDLYAKAIERNPNNAELYNNVGLLYRSTGELERAEDAYRRAISINPKFAAAWSNLGVLLEQRGKRKEATAALQQALALDPSNTGSKVNLANQFYAIGVYANAQRLLEEVLRVNPSLAEAHYSLARTLESLGERAGAIQEYELFLTTGAGQFPALEKQVTQHLKTLKGGKGGNDV
ncbi:MAG: tetratricopeptide repeat protein [Gemmatimonadaceae bacterium]|nr:tetratricopeptide repeat protein [Gemmatimonadaceae bacterium]